MVRRVPSRRLVFTCSALALVIGHQTAHGEFAGPGLVKDINVNLTGQPDVLAVNPATEGNNFSPGFNAFASGGGAPYQLDQDGSFMGNDVLVITQDGTSAFDGAGFTISISNGENGDGYGAGGSAGVSYWADGGATIQGSDPSNIVAADPVFSAIGNSSGRLENGNVIRFSVWVRKDPNAPLMIEPQITPIIKLEFWRDALGGVADFTGGVTNPNFGSRIFDTDQNGVAIPDPAQRARVLDIDGNNTWTFGNTTEPAPTTDQWQQIVHTYVVDDTQGTSGGGAFPPSWDIDPLQQDIPANGTIIEDVTYVEEIRAVMFMGDYTGNSLGGPGNLLWDNALVEIFKDTTAESAVSVLTSNPSPALDEGVENADFNGDLIVDGSDFVIWQQNFPTASGAALGDGDADGNGIVDQADLAIWSGQYGTAAGALGAVPEPSTAAIALAGLLGLAAAIRQRHR